ncbi:hypothetical protein CBM2606_A30249 [Cupriavidus taiwanensis]|nr:hypothetical protein CBM2606_A30249 [Cupriavidus taiwanensis]
MDCWLVADCPQWLHRHLPGAMTAVSAGARFLCKPVKESHDPPVFQPARRISRPGRVQRRQRTRPAPAGAGRRGRRSGHQRQDRRYRS